MDLKVGDKVRKNPETWVPNDFDGWGRGEGVGEVVDVAHISEGEVDIRWPNGRCYENLTQLLPVKKPSPDVVKRLGQITMALMSYAYADDSKPEVAEALKKLYAERDKIFEEYFLEKKG